jgi:hypothetical protein
MPPLLRRNAVVETAQYPAAQLVQPYWSAANLIVARVTRLVVPGEGGDLAPQKRCRLITAARTKAGACYSRAVPIIMFPST